MAMPQSDDTIEAIKRLDALREYAVMHGDEAERIREERTGGCVGFAEGRRSRGDRPAEMGVTLWRGCKSTRYMIKYRRFQKIEK